MRDEDFAAPPRSRQHRKSDALETLRGGVDLWVASASENARAYLVPLSYYWDGSRLTIATPRASRTAPEPDPRRLVPRCARDDLRRRHDRGTG